MHRRCCVLLFTLAGLFLKIEPLAATQNKDIFGLAHSDAFVVMSCW